MKIKSIDTGWKSRLLYSWKKLYSPNGTVIIIRTVRFTGRVSAAWIACDTKVWRLPTGLGWEPMMRVIELVDAGEWDEADRLTASS